MHVVSGVPPAERLYAVEAAHRVLPAAAGVALAGVAARLDRARPARWADALDRAGTLLGDARHGAAPALAALLLREERMGDELFWRPWRVPRMPVEGAEYLLPGTPQILAGLHLGPMPLLQHVLALRLGARLCVSRWAAAEDEPQSGRRALYTPRKVQRLEAAGARMVPRGGSFPVLWEALDGGATVWLAVDAPSPTGGRPSALLGRTLPLGTGIAALAFATGAEVVPAYAVRRRHRAVGVLGAPLRPADFADPDALHDHLTAWADRTLRRHLPQALPEVTLLLGWY